MTKDHKTDCKDHKRKTDDHITKTEDHKRKTEDHKRKTEDHKRKTEDHKTETEDHKTMTEDKKLNKFRIVEKEYILLEGNLLVQEMNRVFVLEKRFDGVFFKKTAIYCFT